MPSLTHLQRLEAESIDILRYAVAESERPVMLYSIGKDSSVMLHLQQSVLPIAATLPPAPCGHHLEVQGDVHPSGARGGGFRLGADRSREPLLRGARDQPV